MSEHHEEEKKREFRYNAVTGVVIAVLAVLSVVGIVQYKRANELEQSMENQYVRSFHDMADYVRDVDVLLKKSMLATGANQMSSLSSQVFMQAASAKACLAQLPTENEHLDKTSKFLSQVGDYTSYLSSKVIDSGKISDEEYATLMELSKTASAVNSGLEELQSSLYAGQLSFDSVTGITAHASEETDDDTPVGLAKIEQEFQDYPTLIYDGPFSEHIEKLEPEMLKGKIEVSQDTALEMAKSFLKSRADNLSYDGETGGSIPAYSFSSPADGDSQVNIEITKQDGMVLWMLDSRPVGDAVLSVDDAKRAGADFLEKMGYHSMKESYYDRSDNVATINYAYVQNGVTMYSDLIKVKIALDNGDIIGFESRGYLMSHKQRDIPQNLISEAAAKAKINPHLTIQTSSMAMIPLESKREVLCYAFQGSFDDQNFIIYINAATGKEEKILMLIESEDGILTM